MQEYNAPELTHLLSLANNMREAKGDEKLEALPPSTRQHPRACIIANAFNYNCAVFPNPILEGASIRFQTKEDAIVYCKIVGIDTSTIKTSSLHSLGKFHVGLTSELNYLALNFDHGAYYEDGF